ncbi:hypothetical protein FB473_001813 [Brooklawnia cerclae]|uniref:LPXTG cell wall anchor domain-containing protein n=1 Tax=Brooklawnia cerclae TaxID=349934 RepID=A0ABX0SFJ4_9ACTN|nr:hypothetical protein [Brooklawnia cerclae]
MSTAAVIWTVVIIAVVLVAIIVIGRRIAKSRS